MIIIITYHYYYRLIVHCHVDCYSFLVGLRARSHETPRTQYTF